MRGLEVEEETRKSQDETQQQVVVMTKRMTTFMERRGLGQKESGVVDIGSIASEHPRGVMHSDRNGAFAPVGEGLQQASCRDNQSLPQQDEQARRASAVPMEIGPTRDQPRIGCKRVLKPRG